MLFAVSLPWRLVFGAWSFSFHWLNLLSFFKRLAFCHFVTNTSNLGPVYNIDKLRKSLGRRKEASIVLVDIASLFSVLQGRPGWHVECSVMARFVHPLFVICSSLSLFCFFGKTASQRKAVVFNAHTQRSPTWCRNITYKPVGRYLLA